MRNFAILLPLLEWGLCFTLGVGVQAEALISEKQAESYLDSFKRRALDAAFESGARVKGIAYIDDQGRLHERAMFSGEADVRGVQIQSYLEAMSGEVPPLEAIQVTDAARCELWSDGGRLSGMVSILVEPDNAGVTSSGIYLHRNAESSERAIRREQETVLLESLTNQLSMGGFRALDPVFPTPKNYQDTTYARTLVGDWHKGPAADFSVTLKLSPLPDDRVKDDLYMNHPGFASVASMTRFIPLVSSPAKPANFDVSLTYAQPAAERVLGNHRAVIEASAYRAVSSGAWVIDQNLKRLNNWLVDSVSEFTKQASCMPRLLSVEQDGIGGYSIGAGLSRGISEGTWLLAGDRQLMVDGIVSDQTLEALVMLKVTRAEQHRAIAEPLPAGEGALVPQGDLLGVLP